MLLNGVATDFQRVHEQLRWSQGPAGARQGALTLLLDPISLHPLLHGVVEGHKVVGLVPVAAGLRRHVNDFGLSAAAWEQLYAAQESLAWSLGGLIWHQWERASLVAQIINRCLIKHLP